MKNAPQKTEVKLVKHSFSLAERDSLGLDLAQALSALRGLESEFDQVKAEYKSRITAAETKITGLETARINGFEMRKQECFVVFNPSKREKYFFAKDDDKQENILLTETMTNEDFITELLQAESVFDERAELELFPVAGEDFGFLVLGKLEKRWFAALRVRIGKKSLEERLDSEQPSFKNRYDCVQRSLKRYNEWLVKEIGKDNAVGFQDGIHALLNSQKEK